MYQNFIIPFLYENQHVLGDTPSNHQEPKTALAASGFSYVEGYWTCSWWTLSGTVLCMGNEHVAKEPGAARREGQSSSIAEITN
jgi:hypothetical protein